MLREAPLAIVDLETTGTHPARDRVTEIAVLEVNGFELAAEWSTLVNPETGIEPGIQALTGISNEMVAAAPRFAALAAELYERLDGRLLIAHNARFDYGFLRREFERAGLKYLSKTLCTVKLSRRLYPGHARHNLDSLIERFLYPKFGPGQLWEEVAARIRAGGGELRMRNAAESVRTDGGRCDHGDVGSGAAVVSGVWGGTVAGG